MLRHWAPELAIALAGAWPPRRLVVARMLLALSQCIVLLLLAHTASGLGMTLIGASAATAQVGQLAALIALSALLAAAQAGVSTRAKLTAEKFMRLTLFARLQKARLRDAQKHPTGDILNRLNQDVETLVEFTTAIAPSIGPQMLMAMGALFLMATIDTALAALSATVVTGLLLSIRLAARALRPMATAQAQAQSKHIEMARALFAHLTVTKAFGREEAAIDHFSVTLDHAELASRRLAIYSLSLPPATWLLASFGLLGLLVMGNNRGFMSTEQMLSFIVYALVLARGAGAMATFYGSLQRTLAAGARITELQQIPIEVGGTHTVHPGPVDVTFTAVNFGYRKQEALLNGINLRLEPGTITALTGPNGAGKSTLAALLLRFESATTGTIHLNGADIQTLSTEALRQTVAWVPQQAHLLSGTIATNIGWGRANASREDIKAAATLATAHSFISTLPDGLDTVIGDGHIPLSGGEMQRIAIARAILANAPILILDEATSMFAPEDDERLFDTLQHWLQTRTVLCITHRVTTLARADRVLHLDGGFINERNSCSI